MKAQYGEWVGTLAQGALGTQPHCAETTTLQSRKLLQGNKPIVGAHATKGSLSREAANHNHRKVKVADSDPTARMPFHS